MNELCRIHESLKVKYTNTLYDSRCILFNGRGHKRHKIISTDLADLATAPSPLELTSLSSNGSNKENSSLDSSGSSELMMMSTGDNIECTKKLEDNYTTPSNFKSQAFFYPENDPCHNLETNVIEFLNSLFWILESKRLEKSREKIDKVILLQAPFEKKDFVGLDLDTRNNRKRCMGRVTKNLADLTLQAGLVKESLTLFHAASETLRAISDSLWLGAANEGLCAASAILLYPNVHLAMSLQRNASLQENVSPTKLAAQQQQQSGASQDTLTKQILNKKSDLNINLDSEPIQGKGGTGSSSAASSASSSTSSVSSMLSSSSGTPSIERRDPIASMYPPNILLPDDIPARYRDAIINYSKYRHAAIIETEAALKAARICIEQNQNLDVAMFLQNVLYINLNMNEQERVQRFETLTELYQRIGYHRKAAFCQRLAAWRHVAQSNTNPDWSQSYRLMLDSFSGHKLSLDPIEVLQNNAGWPCLQIDLLQQLVAAARRLGHSALATRHMTFLLQTMWKHLSANEQREMALQLQVTL